MSMWARTEYATRDLLELALARMGRPLTTGEISGRQRIPHTYLKQILFASSGTGM